MAKQKQVTYKGYPLMRCGNEYYYGYASDSCFILMVVMSQTVVDGVEIPDNISVHLMSSDTTKPLPQRIIRRADKKGLSEALQLSYIWLSRELAPKTEEKKESNKEEKN